MPKKLSASQEATLKKLEKERVALLKKLGAPDMTKKSDKQFIAYLKELGAPDSDLYIGGKPRPRKALDDLYPLVYTEYTECIEAQEAGEAGLTLEEYRQKKKETKKTEKANRPAPKERTPRVKKDNLGENWILKRFANFFVKAMEEPKAKAELYACFDYQEVKTVLEKYLEGSDYSFMDALEAYMDDPHQMPRHVVARASDDCPMPRVIADYIAGMTDRFALGEYAKLYDPYEKV